MNSRLRRAILAFAWFDLGLLLVLLPWTPLWESNYLLSRHPGWIPFLLNGYLRGAISGLGAVDILFAAQALLEGPLGAAGRR